MEGKWGCGLVGSCGMGASRVGVRSVEDRAREPVCNTTHKQKRKNDKMDFEQQEKGLLWHRYTHVSLA
jgi:hypothetical protein